jgi:CHAT domain-containing protein
LTEAQGIFKELNHRAGLANEANNIGGVYLTWGDYRKALEYFDQALEMRRALGHRRQEAIALNNIGRVYDLLGEAQKALDYHRQALELRRTLGDRVGEGASLNNIGLVYGWLGEKDKELDYYQQALSIFRATGDRGYEASTLNNIASFYLYTRKEPRAALQYQSQALDIRRALGQRLQEATELDNIGFIHNRMGDPRKALEYHLQAFDLRRALGHPPGEAASLGNIGAAYAALGETEKALNYYRQSLELQRKIENRHDVAKTLYNMALLEQARGNLEQARSEMAESLNIIESLRGNVANQDLRASFVANNHEYYESYVDLLMRMHQLEPSKGHDLAALQVSERGRARSLIELLAEARIDLDQGISPELKQRERANHSRISWIQSRLIQAYSQAKPDQDKISSLESELKSADAEREGLDSEIRQRHPRYADLRYPAPLDLKVIQSLLDERTLLLEYSLGKDASFLFAIGAKDFQVVRLAPASTITEQIETLRPVLTSRPQRDTLVKQISSSRRLYRELIEPAAKLLAGKQRLIIAPSGVLHYLPFEALLSSGDVRTLESAALRSWPYLVRDYAISYVPSAGVLASLRRPREQEAGPRKTFLAFADPLYGAGMASGSGALPEQIRSAFSERSWKLGRLPESRREVEQIAALYPRDQVSLAVGEQATEENVKLVGRLGQYRFVHFATHGLLNEERPQYSGLILSLPTVREAGVLPARKPEAAASKSAPDPSRSAIRDLQFEDGLLQVYEVFNLKLNADLVVLSACETGLGKEVRGEGLIGLTQGFFYAGTPSVMVSLWSVQDESTADLMVTFYRQLNNSRDKADALRGAKVKLIQSTRYSHPYYWASFVLMGESK